MSELHPINKAERYGITSLADSDVEELVEYARRMEGQVEARQRRITQLEEALRRYGRHDDLCAVVGGYPYGCTCGFRAVLANKEET